MESHPIPKNLMDVEFKLFGSLTVKQFGSLALSFLFAVLIHLSPLPAVIELPLKIAFVGIGFGMAFVKIHGQTFDKYMTNFLMAMLTPQRMIWKKENKAPKSLTQSFAVPQVKKKDTRKRELIENIMKETEMNELFQPPEATNYEKQIMKNINGFLGESGTVGIKGGVKPRRREGNKSHQVTPSHTN